MSPFSFDALGRLFWTAGFMLFGMLAVLLTPVFVLYAVQRRRLKRRRLHPETRCPRCGYDCRATPERCPECGL